MRRLLLCVAGAVFLPAQLVLATVASDMAAGMSAEQAAGNALAAGQPVPRIIDELVAAGVDLPIAVAAIAANADCPPTVEAVRTGVRRDASQAGVIADGAIAANAEDCPCCAQIIEAAATVAPQRVGDIVRAAVGNYTVLRGGCGCTNDVVEAAIRGAPDRSEEVITAAVARTPGGAGLVVDSIGQVGFHPGDEWGEGIVSTQDNTLRRKVDACLRDNQDHDPFDPTETWQGHNRDHTDGLGYHSANCPPSGELALSEYVEGSGDNRAVEIYNGTNQVIDLGGHKYAIEVYRDGETSPSSLIRLSGSVQPGQVFVLSHDNASEAIAGKANQTGDLVFDGSDAVVLVKYPRESNCQCAFGLVQAGLNLVPDQWEVISTRLRRDWLYGCWLNASTLGAYGPILGTTLLTPIVQGPTGWAHDPRSIPPTTQCQHCGTGGASSN